MTAHDKPLYSAQRKQAILTTLAAAGRVDVAAMADELAVTSETVRKDLIALERQGQLRRVHGGAIPLQDLSFEPEVTASVEFAEEKRRIAKAALAHLPRAGTILIDAGSTTARLAELIPPDRQLTAFTNTLPIALALAAKPNVTVYTLGGRVRNVTLAEVDSWAARTLGEINVDVAFLGANGISPTAASPRRTRPKPPSSASCSAAPAGASCWPTTARSTRSRRTSTASWPTSTCSSPTPASPRADEEALNAAGLTTEKT